MHARSLYECVYQHIFLSAAFASVLFLFGVPSDVHAATIVNYSDRLSSSAPSLPSNHTINFETTVALNPGDDIRFTPDPGQFDIPATDFDVDNVELWVSTGGPYTLRSATTSPTASEDGIAITPGSNGNVTITLNDSFGIPANARLRLMIGNHTTNGTTTDARIINPSATGTYAYDIATKNLQSPHRVTGRVAIVDQVTIPNIDTTETIPPVRFNGAPLGEISGTTQQVEISLETDEFARCRYTTTASGTPFFSMGFQFSTNFTVIHTVVFTVAPDTAYTLFVRCIDDEGNANQDDYVINFTVLPPPTGTPNPDGSDPDGTGTGTGSGSGSSGTGSGSSSGGGGGATSGGGGGGGSGGSGETGGGGLTPPERAYQSGDGEVIIRGYAFPQSTVVVLVDGKIARETRADSQGAFTVTLSQIARGAYSFGVYAIDRNNVRSSTFSTTFTVTGSRASTLSNINAMPSVSASPNPVNPGTTLIVRGYTLPNAEVTIENQNDRSSAGLKTFTTTSDGNGAWSINVPTDGLSVGTYKVRAKARQATTGISTNFSAYTFYGVGQAAQVPRGSDLNRDGKVNLIDFSILLFWWNTNGGTSNPSADINGDGRVSLTDFSIMIFNWTG